MLYPAHSMVGRGNLVLKHSVPHFLPNAGLRVEWQNSTPRLASTPERRNGNIHLSKYFISSSGDRTHNQSVLQSHFVPLHHYWPLKEQYLILNITHYTFSIVSRNVYYFPTVENYRLIKILAPLNCRSPIVLVQQCGPFRTISCYIDLGIVLKVSF